MTKFTLSALRAKHPRFVYQSFELRIKDNLLYITYHFLLEPNIHFTPTLQIPVSQDHLDQNLLDNLVFNLGLAEVISYYKAACPPEVIIEAGHLEANQIAWWHDLFIHGLGEFFYQNQIDFTGPDFLTLKSSPETPTFNPSDTPTQPGDLILIGGGKDSIVTLTSSPKTNRTNVMLSDPTPAAIETAKIASFLEPITINRLLDPKLLELNSSGYLNGHTPFSAYLAFVSLVVAYANGFNQVIVSNESSAGEGNAEFHGLEVNHQYSKTYRFESRFRDYVTQYLTPGINYFSYLRPLTELQIAALFTRTHEFDQAFSSCNVTRNQGWCGHCPKCAFVYLVLNSFMPQTRLKAIFGPNDLFKNPEIQTHLNDLVGLGPHKPFDCVGTIQDSRDALILTLDNLKSQSLPLPPILESLATKLNLDLSQAQTIRQNLKTAFNDHHFLPDPYAAKLKSTLQNLA